MNKDEVYIYIITSTSKTGYPRIDAFDDAIEAAKHRNMMHELLWKCTITKTLLHQKDGK